MTPKFKCHYCEEHEYDIIQKEGKNHVWESHSYKIVKSKCCGKEYSIDYLYLHEGKTVLHSR